MAGEYELSLQLAREALDSIQDRNVRQRIAAVVDKLHRVPRDGRIKAA
jgi:hypothetical protein